MISIYQRGIYYIRGAIVSLFAEQNGIVVHLSAKELDISLELVGTINISKRA